MPKSQHRHNLRVLIRRKREKADGLVERDKFWSNKIFKRFAAANQLGLVATHENLGSTGLVL